VEEADSKKKRASSLFKRNSIVLHQKDLSTSAPESWQRSENLARQARGEKEPFKSQKRKKASREGGSPFLWGGDYELNKKKKNAHGG